MQKTSSKRAHCIGLNARVTAVKDPPHSLCNMLTLCANLLLTLFCVTIRVTHILKYSSSTVPFIPEDAEGVEKGLSGSVSVPCC